MNRRTLLLLCAILLAACQAAQPPDPGAPGPGPAASDQGTAPPAEDAGGPAGSPDGGGQGQGDGIGPTPDRGAVADGRRLDDLGALGSLCRDYLRASRLVVEIDWQRSAEPSSSARDHLLATLRQVTGGDVSLADGTEIPGEREVWTSQDLRATAAAHRTQYSRQGELAMYVLSVNGRYEDEGALGVAHRASEFAMFPRQIGRLSGLLGGRAAMERAVMVHEAGHLLCLVNIGYTSAFDREDPEHPKHSSDRGSVMHWAIDTSAVGQLFNGPPPDSFSDQDLADLEGLRSGRY